MHRDLADAQGFTPEHAVAFVGDRALRTAPVALLKQLIGVPEDASMVAGLEVLAGADEATGTFDRLSRLKHALNGTHLRSWQALQHAVGRNLLDGTYHDGTAVAPDSPYLTSLLHDSRFQMARKAYRDN